MIIERAVEMKKNLCPCVIGFQKAFNTEKHEKMIEMLQDIGTDEKDMRIIRNLY